MIKVSNKYELESKIANGRTVLTIFYASWCPFCRSFLPIFVNCSKNAPYLMLNVEINDYDNPLWDEYAIAAVPTIILFKDGKVCKRLDGRLGQGLSEKEFKQWIEEETDSKTLRSTTDSE